MVIALLFIDLFLFADHVGTVDGYRLQMRQTQNLTQKGINVSTYHYSKTYNFANLVYIKCTLCKIFPLKVSEN